MKSLRRSLNSKDSGGPSISSPVALPPLHKPPSAVLPPKKVIRALQPYRPQAPQELGFSKGDFFYVVSEVSGGQGWYEAHNPVSGARGLVPKACFEEFHKANAVTHAISPTNHAPAFTPPARSMSARSRGGTSSSRHRTFYAVVLHDFNAERTDELEAKTGEPITVVAQSNEEWFVAKPIGKLGKPGLIPAAFVELRDPATNLPLTDVPGIIARGELPKVEDWKRAMQEYKQSSISLGVIEDRPAGAVVPANQHIFSASPPPEVQAAPIIPTWSTSVAEPPPDNRPPTPLSMQDRTMLPPGVLVSAEVVDFHVDNDEYWFRINAIYQPEDHSSNQTMPARQLVLFRVYDDFYDFQIALLDAFPVEAGREIGPPSPRSEGGPAELEPTRILPYMPGPVPQVDDVVTALRREELDDYLGQLCALREINAEHVLRHPLVRSFFSPKPGDVETLLPVASVTEERNVSSRQYDGNQSELYEDTRDGLSTLSLGLDGGHFAETRQYEDDRTPHYSSSRSHGRASEERATSRSGLSTHARIDLTTSPVHSSLESKRPGYHHVDSIPLSDGGQSSPSSRGPNSASSPPISGGNTQTAFVKIKIFHRRTDDLIAIRVSPRVSHMQLMEKVRERLGDVQSLSYRDSLTGAFTDLRDDYSLRGWVDHADKHVLYAV